MRPSAALVLVLAGCAAPPAAPPVPEPPRGAYLRLEVEEAAPAPPSRRALEAEWPPVAQVPARAAPERVRRKVRPRARWVTAADGAVVEVVAVEGPLACPIPIRVVRLPDPPAFLLDPPE